MKEEKKRMSNIRSNRTRLFVALALVLVVIMIGAAACADTISPNRRRDQRTGRTLYGFSHRVGVDKRDISLLLQLDDMGNIDVSADILVPVPEFKFLFLPDE